MKVLILNGSPRKDGCTARALREVADTLHLEGIDTETVQVGGRDIRGCLACGACKSAGRCVIDDLVNEVAPKLAEADGLLVGTPVYYAGANGTLKALMDRLVYVMNKYYGEEKGPSIWKGKSVAVLETCGYPPEKGSDLFEEGVRRFCKHSGLNYLGSHVERHMGYQTVFMDENKAERSRLFARELLSRV